LSALLFSILTARPRKRRPNERALGQSFKKKKSAFGLNEAPWSAEINAMPHGARF
jgi:hypothetical protein